MRHWVRMIGEVTGGVGTGFLTGGLFSPAVTGWGNIAKLAAIVWFAMTPLNV